MRIAYIVHNDTHGDSRVLKYLDSAAGHGHEARLFAVGGGESRFPPGEEQRLGGGVIVRLGPRARRESKARPARKSRLRWLQLGVRQWTFGFRAAARIILCKPDVVHAHDADTLFAALLVHLVGRVPFVYDAHELWEGQKLPSWIAIYYRWILNRSSARWAGTITVSGGIQEWMVQRFGLATPPVLVRNVPLAASVPAQGSAGSLRARGEVPEGGRIVVHVGLMGPARGVVETVQAMKLLPPDVYLVLIGPAPQRSRDSIAAIAEQHGVVDRVRFVDPVPPDDVPTVISDADVSVVYPQPVTLNALYSLPNKLFQSIQAGLPVVASDTPDVADVVTTLGVGPVAPARDVPALARAISDVLEAGEEYRDASRRAAPLTTWESEFERADALYRSVVGR